MKISSSFAFFIILIDLYSCLILWNFNNSAIEITSKNITIYEGNNDNITIKLIKEMNKNGTSINYLKINCFKNEKEWENITEWEDIESFYKISGRIFICPKGKYFLNEFLINEKILINTIPKDFNRTESWNLKCHNYTYNNPLNNSNLNFILVSFLNLRNEKSFYLFSIKDNNYSKFEVNNGIFEYTWIDKDFDFSKIYGISMRKNTISLIKGYILNEINTLGLFSFINIRLLENMSNNFYSAFDNDSNIFYWIGWNDSCDFRNGHTTSINEKTKNINFTKKRFDFNFTNFTINEMNFIKNSKYIYYNITDNNSIYYGIIDLSLNKMVFNTDERITYYKPLNNNSMLALTNSSVYEICAIKNNNICIYKCPENEELKIDKKGNYCQEKKKKNNLLYIVFIVSFISIITAALLIILIYIKKKNSYMKRKRELSIINKIHSELKSNLNESTL